MTKRRKFILQATGIFIVLAIWEIVGQIMGEMLLAPPSLVAITYVKLLVDGEMLIELAKSLRQMIVGYGLACLVGMPLGALMGRVQFEKIADFSMGMVRIRRRSHSIHIFL